MSSEIYEFPHLFQQLSKSGCAKKHTAAGTYVHGLFVWAVNFCEYQGPECPRLHMPSGQGYDLCKANHAEANLAKKVTEMGGKSDGILWLVGHLLGLRAVRLGSESYRGKGTAYQGI